MKIQQCIHIHIIAHPYTLPSHIKSSWGNSRWQTRRKTLNRVSFNPTCTCFIQCYKVRDQNTFMHKTECHFMLLMNHNQTSECELTGEQGNKLVCNFLNMITNRDHIRNCDGLYNCDQSRSVLATQTEHNILPCPSVGHVGCPLCQCAA